MVTTLKRKNSDAVEDLRPPDASANRITSRWNNEELLLAVQGVRKFGKDFLTIAEMIGTKTEAQVRTFFVNYRRRYNLDNMVTEFEANAKKQQKEQQQQQQTQPIDANMIREQEPEIMEVSLCSITMTYYWECLNILTITISVRSLVAHNLSNELHLHTLFSIIFKMEKR